MRSAKLVLSLVLCLAAALAGVASAEVETYQVTITNITRAQILNGFVVATHDRGSSIFRSGQPASPELAALAEDADNAALAAVLEANPGVMDVAVHGGLPPGASVTFELRTSRQFPRFSAVAMLVSTNDAFMGIDRAVLHGGLWRKSFRPDAYDAGSEANNEDCAFIPGPPCGNAFVRATDGAEGFVHVHNGIHGIGDLTPSVWDWRNPVATITAVRTSRGN